MKTKMCWETASLGRCCTAFGSEQMEAKEAKIISKKMKAAARSSAAAGNIGDDAGTKKFRSSLSPVLGPYRAVDKNDRLGSDLGVFGMFWPRMNREQLSLRDEKDWHKVVSPYNISANNMLAAKKLSKTILAAWLVQYADGE